MKFQADKKHVSVTGRTIYREGIRYLGYSATSISFKFVGTKATAEIVSDASKHTEKEWAWIAIYYGQDRDPAKRLRLEQGPGRQSCCLKRNKLRKSRLLSLNILKQNMQRVVLFP